MSSSAHALWLLALAGCGRFMFDEQTQADANGAGDAFDCGHTFCDDFDRAGPPEAAWDSITMTGGTMALVSDMAVSAPNSLLVTVPVDGTTLTGNAFLHKQLPLTTTRAVVHVKMQYATASTQNTESDLVRLKWNALPDGCTSFGYYLVRDGTKPLNVQETYGDAGSGGVCAGGNVQNLTMVFDNSPTFMDVTLEITFGTLGTAHIKLTVDGAVLVDAAAAHPIAPSALTLDLGGGVSRNGLTPWTYRYDDLTVDLDR